MAVLSGAIRLRRYSVTGKPPADIRNAYEKSIRKFAFIEWGENDSREEAIGWTAVDDWFDIDLFPDRWLVGDLIFLNLRSDVRKIPAKILSHECGKLEAEWKERFERDRLSRAEREEIKNLVTARLSQRVLPTIKGADFCWDLKREEVLFFSGGASFNETFSSLFEKTFEVKVSPLFPFAQALDVLGEEGGEAAKGVAESTFAAGGGR